MSKDSTKILNEFGKDSPSDRWQEYLVLAQTGDRVAYEKLLSELLKVLPTWVRRRFGKLLDPMEVTQETLLAIHLYLNTFDPKRPAKAWISGIFNHKCVDQIRKLEREGLKSGHFKSDSFENNRAIEKNLLDPVTSIGPDANEYLIDTASDVELELNLLDPEMKQAIEMTKLEGLSTDEAAKKVGISPAAMRKRISRGLQQLRRSLTKMKAEDL